MQYMERSMVYEVFLEETIRKYAINFTMNQCREHSQNSENRDWTMKISICQDFLVTNNMNVQIDKCEGMSDSN